MSDDLWIASHRDLEGHRKLRNAARLAGVDEVRMIGHLHLFWWSCTRYVQDGCLANYDDADIAEWARWEGDPTIFAEALRNCGPGREKGFLCRGACPCRDGQEEYLPLRDERLHNWWLYFGKYLRDREARARRARERRAAEQARQKEDDVRNGRVPVTAPARKRVRRRYGTGDVPDGGDDAVGYVPDGGDDVAGDVPRNRTGEDRREEERTEEDRTGPEPATETAPPATAADDLLGPTGVVLTGEGKETFLEILSRLHTEGRTSEHRTLAELVREYPEVDLPYEAGRCWEHHKGKRKAWGRAFRSWITFAKSVRYRDGSNRPPKATPLRIVPPPRIHSDDAVWDEALDWIEREDAQRRDIVGDGSTAWDQVFKFVTCLHRDDDVITLGAPNRQQVGYLQGKGDAIVRDALVAVGHGDLTRVYRQASAAEAS